MCTVLSHKDDPSDGDYIMGGRIQYENTYRMEPEQRFPVGPINNVLDNTLAQYLEDQTYDAEFCRKMTKIISDVSK